MTFLDAVDQGARYHEVGRNRFSETNTRATGTYTSHKADYLTLFYECLARWRADTAYSSRIKDKVEHSDFLKIVGIGRPALPLIVDELRRHPDFLFLALHDITGENPVPSAYRGQPTKVVEAWLSWAERNNVSAE